MNEQTANTNMVVRLAALEIRISALESLVNNAIGASSSEPRPSKKKDASEKEKIKADLLKRVPYDKKALEELGGAKVKMLASALGIKAFGLKQEEIVKAILGAQKKK
jgi:hypothetical protein